MFAPERQGFFPALWVQLLQELTTREREEFNNLTSREDRVQWMYSHRFPKTRFELLRAMRQEKDPETSVKKREVGNKAFVGGDLHTAMVNYSRAVVLASENTQELASAYANRAACLQRLGCPEVALTDLDLAVESGYQHQNMFKLLERRGQCLTMLKRYKEARFAFEEAISSLKLSKLDKKKREKFLKDTRESLEKITVEEDKLSESPVQATQSTAEKQKELILNVESQNTKFEAASSSMNVKYQKGRGRFVIAKQDIPVGTTLVVEKPITWAIHPERYGTHCQECLSQIKAVIPCKTCCGVSFCSIKCRDIALSSYHRYECGANHVLIASGLNIYPFLTFRLMAKYGLDHIWSLKDRLTSHDDTSGALGDNEYRTEDFINTFNLVCHEDKMDSEDHLLRTFVAVFLLKMLQFNNFFGNFTENEKFEELSEKELFLGKLLLHFTNTFPQNVHDIALLQTSEMKRWVNSSEIKSLGAGVYPTCALFNHSCDPSFMRCNFGKGMVSVANRNILAGEEISECYGQMYYSKNLDTRRAELRKHYKFECQCIPCLENWPTIKEMQYASGGKETKHQDLMRIRCKKCRQELERLKGVKVGKILTCLVCGQETDVEGVPLAEIKEKSDLAQKLLCDKLDWCQGIEAVTDCQAVFDKYLVAPSIELYTTQISIWRALWMMVGNKKLIKGIL